MNIKLPFIGDVKTGLDAKIDHAEKVISENLLGGFLEFAPYRLSGETSISTKLLAANKGWVYRNNDTIASEVSKIEFELFTVGLSQGEVVFNPVTTHPLLDLLDKPNEETTKNDSIYIIQSHRKLTGDAFWLKLRNGGQVVALRPLPPDKVQLNLQTPTEKDPTVIESYLYKDVIKGNKIEVTYQPEDIIHFKRPNPNNAFRGYGVVEAMADTIDLDNLTTELAKKFFQNGAVTNFVLTSPNRLTDEQVARLKAQLRSLHGGVNKAFNTMILGGGLEPKDVSYSNKDMEFTTQLEWYRDKIMVGFGNTKASLGLIDDVNRASHESSLIEWKRNTVAPDMQAIVNTLNEFLVPEFGNNLVLGYKDPVPEDRDGEVKEATELFKGGIVSRDEARETVNLDPVEGEGGDVFLTPGIQRNPLGGDDETE